MSNGSSPDDLSELLDDIASVNDIEDGLISVDGDDYQGSFNEPSHPNTAERQSESNYQGFANNPPNTIDIQKGVYSNPTAVSAPIMSAQDTSELLSSILSSISSAEGNVSDVGFNLLPHIHTGLNNNFTATQPHFGPTDEISPNLFHSSNVLPLSVDNLNTSKENFNNLFQDPGATCTNEQNSSPKSPSGKTIAGNNDSQEKISIINNFIDWDKLKPALIETKKSRKTTPKPEKEPKTIVPDFISGPVKLYLPDIKKFLRSLKRSRKTTKKIQDWDRLMGLKKCHSRTMTKTAASRKRLLQIMQDIAVHANEEKCNAVATKAA